MTETQLRHLDAAARDLAERALDWTDRGWDQAAGLFRSPGDELYERGQVGAVGHMVRETAWYALGLLLRDAPGDRERALRAVGTLLDYQFDAPGRPYHGTWYRSPAEPPPPDDPVVWRDYDPNWREFIGTTLAVMLLEYELRLPVELLERIDIALRRAIDGTLERNVPASYTNIALMTAFLLQFGAARFARAGLGSFGRTAGDGSTGALSRNHHVRRVQLADLLRRRPVRAGPVALLRRLGPAAQSRRGDGSSALARHRAVLSRRNAQCRRSLRSQLWDGHAPLCHGSGYVDLAGNRLPQSAVSGA